MRLLRAIPWRLVGTLLLTGSLLAQDQGARSQAQMPPMQEGTGTTQQRPSGSVKITMEELHRAGGVPPGWRFAFPTGDPKEGRKAFVKFACFTCHEVKGEQFPRTTQGPRSLGPELTGMGLSHPAEYVAESILNPNAVIVLGPGFTGADGRSIMPDYRGSLTVKELVDLVAYLKSLTRK